MTRITDYKWHSYNLYSFIVYRFIRLAQPEIPTKSYIFKNLY